MEPLQRCPKCEVPLLDPGTAICPACGTPLGAVFESGFASRTTSGIISPARVAARVIVPFLAFAAFSSFWLKLAMPKIMIVVFAAFIVLAALLSIRAQSNTARSRQRASPVAGKSITHPAWFRVLSLGIGLGCIAFGTILLFGCVIFANEWSSWQRYEGQRFHRADFQVTTVYFQKHKGGPSVYARGDVEGQREWMSLQGYLKPVPRTEGELDDRVPIGTSIPIYLFPDLKGQVRVCLFDVVPPAEAHHRAATNALNHSLIGLALSAGMMFILTRLRRSCFVAEPSLATARPAQVV